MEKNLIKPGTLLYPLPAVMISCGDINGIYNIITVAWAGTVCSKPPMISISIRKERYSYQLIKNTMDFAVNIPDKNLLYALDFCGNVTGKSHDKFKEAGLTMEKGDKIKAPLIAECPINIECKVRNIIPLGTHDMFIGEVVSARARQELMKSSSIDYDVSSMIGYIKNGYYTIGDKLASQGFSLKKL
ncbi:MAG: flavin reductase family protein [Thermoanaerobacteraceae bacterium]|nr:flavin reductase family protein [Thermoanaerobacteraceae bacterium]